MQAWYDLLLLANHKSTIRFLRGVDVKLNVGELAYSIRSLSNRWRWNERTVKRFLNWLQTKEMIHTKINNVTTIIAIVKYIDYQQNTDQTTDQNTEQLLSRIHTDKNVKNDKKYPPYPPEGDGGCVSSGDEVEVLQRLEKFWSAYPRKEGKGKLEVIWKKLSPSESLLEMMLKALKVQKESSGWKRESGRFIPSAAKWLEDRRWEAVEYQEPVSAPKREAYTSEQIKEFDDARGKGLEKVNKILYAKGKLQ